MTPFALALALVLFLQGQPAAAEAAQPPAPDAAEVSPEDRFPAGAPHDDYQFVAWCYGSLLSLIHI